MVEVELNDDSVDVVLGNGHHVLVRPDGHVTEWDAEFNLVRTLRRGDRYDAPLGRCNAARLCHQPPTLQRIRLG
jgi:hypothetical protein